MPHPYQDLSGTRHREATDYGRVDIQAKDCQIESLTVESKSIKNNPNHADLTGWPYSKPEQKTIAKKIAAATSISQLIPPPNIRTVVYTPMNSA